jgi:peptidoglycan/xylan/chitin deacetylase (PgdA/CDA1 family)
MSMSPRRAGRILGAAILVGAFSLAAPAAQAAPTSPSPSSPSSPSLSSPEGPWPPSQVLAADPATTADPRGPAQAATSCPPTGYGVNHFAPGAGKTVALTFDDGPGTSTAAILQVLQNQGVPATFFNIGVNQTVRPTLVRREAAQGYLLGNHTWSHPNLTTESASAQASEMDQTTREQTGLVGSPPCFFRPPYGSYNSTTLRLAQARHMSVWNWSVDTEDWKAAGSGSSYWVARIIRLAEGGASQSHPVVLMHNSPAGNPATVSALPTILQFYRARGYTFVDLAGGTSNRLPRAPALSVPASGSPRARSVARRPSVRTARGSTPSSWGPIGRCDTAVRRSTPRALSAAGRRPATGPPPGCTRLGGVPD